MALVNRSFSVNVTPGAMPPIVHVSEYDVGRAYTVSILDEQGNTFTIPSGTTASIEGTLNGSVGFTQSATVSNNQVSFTLSQSMTAYSGKAWCKIKLTLNDEPIQTCAFVLAVDRAGVEADTIMNSPGFQEQINEGIAEYFDNDPPFFELPSGGQSGQALLSDGSNGAYWGQARGGGSVITDEVKTALMNVASHIGAWTDDQGSEYVQVLHDALYPPANLSFITASFNQGGAVIYNTDSLNVLKQYLTVVAHYDNQTVQTVTNYALSGTLTVGTSTITVSYGGKTTTFNVTVSGESAQYTGYISVGTPNIVDGILTPSNGNWIKTPQVFNPSNNPWEIKTRIYLIASANDTNDFQDVFSTVTENNTSIHGILMEKNGSRALNPKAPYWCINLSSNNSSWDMSFSSSVPSVSTATTNLILEKFVGEWVYYKCGYDGTTYYFAYSDDGVNWVTETQEINKYVGGGYAIGFGCKRNVLFNGKIDLNKTEIRVNNVLWWRAI